MVRINLIVEGGVYPDNVSADTANNVESLRQSLNRFFTKILKRNDIEIAIFMGNGYRNAAKQFAASDNTSGLFVDSDLPSETKHLWFDKLVNKEDSTKTIVLPEEKMQNIFFMIQEMEAWFLKQPGCIDRWAIKEGYDRKDKSFDISNHSLIRDKDIESISKPSEKLKIIMKRFFFKGKKAARYGKLKHSPILLDSLDADALMPLDKELQRFSSTIVNQLADA